jgi:hypothetical protein
LAEAGYSPEAIEAFIASKAALAAERTTGRIDSRVSAS